MNSSPEWITRKRTIKQLLEELSSFEDQDLEVRVSLDGGDSHQCISLIGRIDGKAVLMNCEHESSVENSVTGIMSGEIEERPTDPLGSKLDPLVDRYAPLRPDEEYETCECEDLKGLLIVDLLSCNPIHCAACRRMVDPERLKLSGELVDAVIRWQSAFGSLYRLWLDSGEYELWAKERMIEPSGQVNTAGLNLAQELSKQLPTRYWWFRDTDDPLPSNCPCCGSNLHPSDKYGDLQCPRCPFLI